MIDRCLYFGCWNAPGHYLHGPGGVRATLPQEDYVLLSNTLDAAYAPRRGRSGKVCWGAMAPTHEDDRKFNWEIRDSSEYPQGRFLLHQVQNYTIIQWWDRCQGDRRPNCNSTIILEGLHTSAEMLNALLENFPHVVANLKKAGVELIEVSSSQK